MTASDALRKFDLLIRRPDSCPCRWHSNPPFKQRPPPQGDGGDAQTDNGAQIALQIESDLEIDCDLATQSVPRFDVDQRVSW